MGNDFYYLKTGSTIAEHSFDAWGRRRDKDDWSYTLTSEPALFADRGFTGHEYLEDFKLYYMNGRLYDPVVGRFLSPDPFIADPSFSQSYNRYAYALNNPLKYVDPSGEINWPAIWFGNWIFGGMNNWINRGMPFKQAFSFKNNPMMVSVNYHPGNNSWSNTQANAQNLVGQMAVAQQNINATIKGFSVRNTGTGSVGFGNIDIINQQFETGYALVADGPAGQGGLGASTIFGAVGVAGDVTSMSNSTFRLMSGANGTFSPKVYSSGWNGGSPARITTYSLSKVGTGVSTGASVVTTYMSYNQIYNGEAQPITYVDAGVGTAGILAAGASYFYGVQIPVVGEFVAVYGALRLTWDVSFYLGTQYGPSKWYGTNDNKWFK